ncbi:MAG: MFS transporter [Planctomycetaceae bacterium]|nr:MFS transporter [Planctomycetaceae bacterium]
MSAAPTPPPPQKLTAVVWLICIIAAIGFAFDIYELLMLPLILRPAFLELTGIKPGTPEFAEMFPFWLGLMFYVPAFAGGLFGLLGGYLTDRLGRRRVLTWSILLYAFSAFFAGFSTNMWMLLVFRTTTFIGVCVEFVAAVAWLAELFPNPTQREKVLGYTQAFSSIGGLLVAVANSLAIDHAHRFWGVALPGFLDGLGDIANPHAPWRYTLMSGLIPAIPLIIIRPFLPESPAWSAKKAAGTLKRPSFSALFAPELRRTTIITTIMFACSYGAAFGAIQQMPQIVPGLVDVQAATAEMPPPKKSDFIQKTAADYTKSQEVGGLVGRFALAMLAVQIVSRQSLIRLFLVPGLIAMPLIFYMFAQGQNTTLFSFDASWSFIFHEVKVSWLGIGIFLAGFFTVAQFSFWGNYLPRVYPVHLRGTGESFAANIGGRMFGTSFAAVNGFIVASLAGEGANVPMLVAYVAAAIAAAVYLLNLILSFFLPEPGPEEE